MDRKIITYGGYFERFILGLTEKEQKKVKYGLLLLKSQDKVSTRFVKYIRDGIYELRTLYNGNGFQKKTQRTPECEIELAIKIKENYYADKRSSDQGL